MSDPVTKKKTVSCSQFTNWWTCPHKWFRDYILHEKVFEDSIHMSFGTAIHEAIQLYLTTLYHKTEAEAEALDLIPVFTTAFKREVTNKKIAHTQADFDEFVEDGKAILKEFCDPSNRGRYFPREKFELLGIENKILMDIKQNVTMDARLDVVMKEKMSGNIRIVDFKTSTRGWDNNTKEDFTKTCQLVLYKSLYSKYHNIPLSKITVEYFILKRKVYEKAKYPQTRLDVFVPSSYQKDVLEVIQEFKKFLAACFTEGGQHKVTAKYPKNPGKNQKNCKYCNYLKNGKCDGIAEPLE
jgi:hypothetical protein